MEPNEEKTVYIGIPVADLTVVNEEEEVVVEPGVYDLWIGKSAANIIHKITFNVVDDSHKFSL